MSTFVASKKHFFISFQMKNKSNRLHAIRMIVQNNRISSQDELLEKLKEAGFDITQATLSRDLKQMKVAKAPDGNGSHAYVLPTDSLYERIYNAQAAYEKQVRSGYISLHFSNNIAVIKTRPGYAGGIAYEIDEHRMTTVLATLGGDDTVLVVLKEGTVRDDFRRELSTFMQPEH